MTDLRSQFNSATSGSNGYIAASLNFMTADTRQGLNGSAVADFAVIKKYASEHPDKSAVDNYVSKIETSLREKATPRVKTPAPFKI